jgi:ribonuclease HIII
MKIQQLLCNFLHLHLAYVLELDPDEHNNLVSSLKAKNKLSISLLNEPTALTNVP